MPALVKSNVGSSCGTTGEEGTKVWPWSLTKKSMNCRRISAEVAAGAAWRARAEGGGGGGGAGGGRGSLMDAELHNTGLRIGAWIIAWRGVGREAAPEPCFSPGDS